MMLILNIKLISKGMFFLLKFHVSFPCHVLFFSYLMCLVGKEKCVYIAIKNYLGMCLRKLVLCLCSDFVNIIAVK